MINFSNISLFLFVYYYCELLHPPYGKVSITIRTLNKFGSFRYWTARWLWNTCLTLALTWLNSSKKFKWNSSKNSPFSDQRSLRYTRANRIISFSQLRIVLKATKYRMFRIVSTLALYWASYESYKKLLPDATEISLLQSFVGGAISGTVRPFL